ncbi:lipase maturation factor 2 [Tribolium castaneum]|uniref:Lipase maturation factor n=1 Tax=Tribolium castaneum TaxID=7070 RepID=D7EJW8_TRICA|nr:PREDICTED: lipase maturation factor 2 [Tribolium castaneum]EFA12890.2 Lipase maturation factor 2-like Protein [Tribolium castaneum]|eukprot:XP_970218.2 PREDICTED: lipase maturation factor 2 [Tribolium castaneum]
MISLRYTRNLFLRSFCIVYLFAFISFYIQIPGLYGDNGILPAKSLLENSKHKTLSAKVHYQPTLLWLAPYLGLDVNYALDVLALLGSFLAFTGFISQKFCTIPLFAGLWSLYFSLYQVGQVFVSNNYDEFLLEAGFLVLLVAPLLPGRRKGSKVLPSDSISFWLVRWLLFRFLLTCGLLKFISGCPKWWTLSAFNYYFETLPLPTPLSWYFHQIPSWYLKLFGVIANVCEIGIPFLFFVPIRAVRITSFMIQIFLQISIVLTGNYNFTNLLMVTLLLSLLDDQFFYGRRKPFTKWTFIEKVINILTYGALLLAVVKLYSLKLDGTIIESNIAFTKDQFEYVLKQGLTITIYLGLISLAVTILRALSISLFDVQGSKVFTIITTILYSGIAVLLFFASTVPLASLHTASNSTVHPSVRTVYNRLHKLHAVNQYGLFPKMMGVDGRPEVILEGSDNVEGPWLEYNFLYKPGNVNHSLPFVAPYSPRLDWQMFWAAYNTYDKQPWILSLTHRLLTGKAEVLALLDRHHSPFNQKPPKYIRGILYKYKYSSWSQRSQPSWWVRQKVGEYFPAYTKESPALVDYLKARNLLPTSSKQTVNPIWKQILDGVRYITGHLEATLLLWSVFTAGCAIITTSAKK